MNTTNDLLDAVKAALKVETDYELAKKLGTRQSQITGWRKKKWMPNNRMAYQIAEIIETPIEEVIALIEIDFAKTDEEKAFWNCALTRALARAASVATRKGAAVLLAAVLALAPSPAPARLR